MTRSGPKFGSTLESRTLIFGSKMDTTTLKSWLFSGYSYGYEYREPGSQKKQ